MEKTMKKQYKTFKEYYADPIFKAKHLKYVSEKIQCTDCGKMIARCNITKHKATAKHLKKYNPIQALKLSVENLTTFALFCSLNECATKHKMINDINQHTQK